MSRRGYRRRELPPTVLGAGGALRLVTQSAHAARAQAEGDEAERLVDAYHGRPDVRAVAVLQRRFAATTVVKGRRVTTSPQGPDFCGYYAAGARHVEVEVKRVTSGRLDLDRVRPLQRTALAACRAAGGVACVLCLVGPALAGAAWCALPWEAVAAALDAGRKSLPERDLKAWRVDVARLVYLGAPWLWREVCL